MNRYIQNEFKLNWIEMNWIEALKIERFYIITLVQKACVTEYFHRRTVVVLLRLLHTYKYCIYVLQIHIFKPTKQHQSHWKVKWKKWFSCYSWHSGGCFCTLVHTPTSTLMHVPTQIPLGNSTNSPRLQPSHQTPQHSWDSVAGTEARSHLGVDHRGPPDFIHSDALKFLH